MINKLFFVFINTILITVLLFGSAISGESSRAGTTVANFLEIGYGSAGNAMGDAYVSVVKDISSVYWNPAGLGYLEQNEFQAMLQPWWVGINTSFAGVGYVDPTLGNFAVGLINVSYNEEAVTTVESQEGTGELFDGSDICFSFTYGKRLVEWFSFGASIKYISSRIWHETASAVAMDLGAVVNTRFLAHSENPGDGLTIGMSISNYGSKMTYDGIDLKRTEDISDDNGNYAYVPTKYELDSWELPLIFRLGVSFYPVIMGNHRVLFAVDALHPNNNSEYVNIGSEYELLLPTYGKVHFRVGYKGIFMENSGYGLSVGAGVEIYSVGNNSIGLDYGFRSFGLLGDTHSYTFKIHF
jgi:hypothetical protein